MNLESALATLTLSETTDTTGRVYTELQSAYKLLSSRLKYPKSHLFGSVYLLEVPKLKELETLLSLVPSAVGVLKDKPCGNTILSILTDFTGKEFHPSRTSIVHVRLPKNSELGSTFEFNYRLAYGLTVSTTAKAMGLDAIGHQFLEQMNKIIDAEVKIKKNWLRALGLL